MRRRQLLAAAGAALGGATAGCQSFFETQRADRPEFPATVADRPDAVYVPSHAEGMRMADTASAGRYRFALSYSYPHRFWLLTGDRVRKVGIDDGDAVHLMFTAWDAETDTVIPASSATVTATKDGEQVLSGRSLWAMLSQNMGVHFGDNVALDGAGTYEVTVGFGPVGTRRAGSLAGALSDRAEPTFSMSFNRDRLSDVSVRRFDDRKGQRDALDPMGGEMIPSSQLPATDAMPGEVRGQATTGDARLVVTTMPAPAGVEGDGSYLAVSPRTPYNRFPLPFMTLAATLSRDGTALFDGDLTPTIHPDLGYHYGAVVDSVRAGDDLRIRVATPPQIARHEGYETAFVEMPDASLTL